MVIVGSGGGGGAGNRSCCCCRLGLALSCSAPNKLELSRVLQAT